MLDLFRYLLENFSGRLEVRSEKNQVNKPVHPPKKAVFRTALTVNCDNEGIPDTIRVSIVSRLSLAYTY